MIGQWQRRPESKQIIMRPTTSKVSEANQKQSEECFLMGKKHMTKKQYPEALRHYFNATMHNPYNYKAFCNMGAILKELGNYKEAKTTYLRALIAKPDDHISLYNFGNLNRICGDEDAAIPLYQKVIQLKEKKNAQIGNEYSSSILNLGVCFKNVGKLDEALEQYQKFISICPQEESGYFNKGMCYMAKIKKTNRAQYKKVHLLLCEEAQKILKRSLQKNQCNNQAKIALIQLNYIKSPALESYRRAVKEFQNLSLELKKDSEIPSLSDSDMIRIKMSYCNMQIQKHQSKKSKTIPKKDKPTSTNTYDQQQKKQKIKEVQSNSPMKVNRTGSKAGDKKEERPLSSKMPRPSSSIRPKTGRSSNPGWKQQFEELLESSRYGEALDIVNSLPDGLEKYQKQILVNFLNGQQAGDQIFLKVARQIYQEKIAVQPISKNTCSKDGHQICAALLVELNDYQSATLHYQILEQILEQQKSLSLNNQIIEQSAEEDLERVRGELGILYAEREMFEPAIEEFKKNLQLHPNNYSTISSLGLCLIESNKNGEALKLYQGYLQKNYPKTSEEQNIEIFSEEQKVTYIDCLINIAICLERQGEKEVEALKKAKKQIERLYPSYNQLRDSFVETNNHLGIYLRLTEIYQQKIENIPHSEVKEQSQQLLDFYLGCLEYPQCPDRSQILVNCGILFYLSGCYSNAYLIYNKIQDKQISNNIGLTLAHLQEFEQSLLYLHQSTRKQPENIIYRSNFEIIKWVCGLHEECQQNRLTKEYACKCTHLLHGRASYGLALIDYLTEILPKNNDKIIRNFEMKIEEQVNSLINFLVKEFEEKNSNKKYAFLSKFMKDHIKGFPVHEGKFEIKKINRQIVQGALCYHPTLDSFQKFLQATFDFVKTLPPNPHYSTYIQLILYCSFLKSKPNHLSPYFLNRSFKSICPSSHPTSSLLETNRNWMEEQNIKAKWHSKFPVLDTDSLHFEQLYIQGAKAEEISVYTHEVPIKYPNSQINIKNLCTWIRDAESAIENDCQFLIQFIEEAYYESKGVVEPFRREVRYPRCKSVTECEGCLLKSIRIYSAFFKSYMPEDFPDLDKSHNIKNVLAGTSERLGEFCGLGVQQSGIYNNQTQKITLQINPYTTPVVLSTHYRNFEEAKQFLKILNPNFELKLHEGDNIQKGVRYLYINKRIVLNMWWGEFCEDTSKMSKQQIEEVVTYFDKFGSWWQNVCTSPSTEAIIMLEQFVDLEKMPQKFEWSSQDNDLVPDGIKLIRYWSEDAEQMYKEAKKSLLNLYSS